MTLFVKRLVFSFISGPLFQTERRTKTEPAIIESGEINPKNGCLLRGLDGKYGRWDEILRDILNGKLMIVQNRKATDTDSEEDDNDEEDDNVEEDEELPEENGTPRVYHTSERDGQIWMMHYNTTQTVRYLVRF